ncbi:hypothetical protein PR202_ga05794 [Eleusine coracana subsp. coracana]|uniref:Dilute domain-containing protein n=1 Tax=Eleusine coracana subsp. coracana TaxID=191504 RepID=A0AAV5BVL4_ELECO|nr:hypothetical protein PR202_ga05794 [Eleusine coracana subsp. coracana]
MDGAVGLHQIEARYPALLFKQQLVDLTEKVYGMISDKLKKELNPLLELCIQDPRTSFSNQSKASLSPATGSGSINFGPQVAYPNIFYGQCSIVQQVSSFLWSYQILLLEVISLKPIRTWEEIRTDVCPALTLQQLERVVGMYWDDVNGTNITSAEASLADFFISSMKATLREESNSVSSFSILLDDDSSIPFSLEDIARSMPNIEDTSDYDLLPFIRENQSFAFLLQ